MKQRLELPIGKRLLAHRDIYVSRLYNPFACGDHQLFRPECGKDAPTPDRSIGHQAESCLFLLLRNHRLDRLFLHHDHRKAGKRFGQGISRVHFCGAAALLPASLDRDRAKQRLWALPSSDPLTSRMAK